MTGAGSGNKPDLAAISPTDLSLAAQAALYHNPYRGTAIAFVEIIDVLATALYSLARPFELCVRMQ